MRKNFLDKLIEFSKVEVTFNREQLKAYREGALSVSDIQAIKYIDGHILPQIQRNRRAYKSLVVALACAGMIISITTTVNAAGIDNIDEVGRKLLGYAQTVAYWVVLFLCIKDIIGALINNGGIFKLKDIGAIILMYLLVFASVYFMPAIMDEIKVMFS